MSKHCSGPGEGNDSLNAGEDGEQRHMRSNCEVDDETWIWRCDERRCWEIREAQVSGVKYWESG